MANLQKKPVRIVITNAGGDSLYSEKVLDHNGYRQLFNFRNFENGEYDIRIMHPNESKYGKVKVGHKSADIIWKN